MRSCARRNCSRACCCRYTTNYCLKCRRRKSRRCASWCAQKWRTCIPSAFRFWWRWVLVRTGAMWIDDYLEFTALHGLAHVTGIADAPDAPHTDIGTGKNEVGEFKQSEEHQRQGDDREYVCHQKQGGTDCPQSRAQG